MSTETRNRTNLTVQQKWELGTYIRNNRERLEADWSTRTTDEMAAEASNSLGFTVTRWMFNDHCLSNGFQIKEEAKREARMVEKAVARKEEIAFSTQYWLQTITDVLVRVTDELGIDNGELKKFS